MVVDSPHSSQEQISFPKEDIPNDDSLYMRIHKNWVDGEGLMPGVFRNNGDGMSTDWNKYSTPEATRSRCNPSKKPTEYGIISMNVGRIRRIKEQVVEHTPLPDNRAHTDVKGDKNTDPQIRVEFSREDFYSWEIRISENA